MQRRSKPPKTVRRHRCKCQRCQHGRVYGPRRALRGIVADDRHEKLAKPEKDA